MSEIMSLSAQLVLLVQQHLLMFSLLADLIFQQLNLIFLFVFPPAVTDGSPHLKRRVDAHQDEEEQNADLKEGGRCVDDDSPVRRQLQGAEYHKAAKG